jgi:hypothetical protein
MRAASLAGSGIPGQLILREILIVISLKIIGNIMRGSASGAPGELSVPQQ